jgi:hypothetical protein
MLIIVSTEVKQVVENEAKAVCQELGLPPDKLNQDGCAITAYRALAKVGADRQKRLEVLKKCANASALRQAISGEKGKTDFVQELSAKLLGEAEE